METRSITTRDELAQVAREVLLRCGKKNTATVIGLSGELGAGKTAFTQELARALGITEVVASPTFVIMKLYNITAHTHFKNLVHMDAYRIESDDEMRVIKFDELLEDTTNLICIEWPEKIPKLIPEDAHMVTFTLNPDGTRTVTMST